MAPPPIAVVVLMTMATGSFGKAEAAPITLIYMLSIPLLPIPGGDILALF